MLYSNRFVTIMIELIFYVAFVVIERCMIKILNVISFNIMILLLKILQNHKK